MIKATQFGQDGADDIHLLVNAKTAIFEEEKNHDHLGSQDQEQSEMTFHSASTLSDNSQKKIIERWEKNALKLSLSDKNQVKRKVENPRILVVDDNYYNIVAITSMFTENQQVEMATDGLEAIKMVKDLYTEHKLTYDLIMMDFEMPICRGPEATRSIRKFLKDSAPELKLPFICCLTSYNTYNCKLEAYHAGTDAFLTKPIFKQGIQRMMTKAGL